MRLRLDKGGAGGAAATGAATTGAAGGGAADGAGNGAGNGAVSGAGNGAGAGTVNVGTSDFALLPLNSAIVVSRALTMLWSSCGTVRLNMFPDSWNDELHRGGGHKQGRKVWP